MAANNIHDQYYIIPLLYEFIRRYPQLKLAYIILDKGYDNEIIYRIIYESYDIIPVIIRKKMVYPKGFTKKGILLCPLGYPMRRKVIDYQLQRTKYGCDRVCLKEKQMLLDICPHLKSSASHGFLRYTYFKEDYRKFGPALPNILIYQKLKPYKTAMERNYGLLKENRYRLGYTNTFKGFHNVLIHVIEHDITLTQNGIFNFKKTGKSSSIIKT